jgi:hypothetical protein
MGGTLLHGGDFMISNVLSDAIQDIKTCQREFPDVYFKLTDAIEAVKRDMAALMFQCDQPEVEDIEHTLDNNERHRWRITCEANIARWVERLRRLVPCSAEDILLKLDDAIKKEEALQKEWSEGLDGLRCDLFRKACESWNADATVVARDAIEELLNEQPDEALRLVGSISRFSEYWTEMVVRAAFGMPNEESGDLASLQDAADEIIRARKSQEP